MFRRLAILSFFFAPLFFQLLSFSVQAADSDDVIRALDAQRRYVDRVMRDMEEQRAATEAQKKIEIDQQIAQQKRNQEVQIAQQFAGLSGTLSGLPELPNLNGKFSEKSDAKESSLT